MMRIDEERSSVLESIGVEEEGNLLSGLDCLGDDRVEIDEQWFHSFPRQIPLSRGNLVSSVGRSSGRKCGMHSVRVESCGNGRQKLSVTFPG